MIHNELLNTILLKMSKYDLKSVFIKNKKIKNNVEHITEIKHDEFRRTWSEICNRDIL